MLFLDVVVEHGEIDDKITAHKGGETSEDRHKNEDRSVD